jgi:hypothetical protein
MSQVRLCLQGFTVRNVTAALDISRVRATLPANGGINIRFINLKTV